MDIVKTQTVDPVQLTDAQLGKMDVGQLMTAFNEIKDTWAKLSADTAGAEQQRQQEIDVIQSEIDVGTAMGTLTPAQLEALEQRKREKIAARDYLHATITGMSDSSQSIDVSCYVPTVFSNNYTVKVQDFQPPQSAAPELSAVLSGSVLAVVKKLRDETKWAQQR